MTTTKFIELLKEALETGSQSVTVSTQLRDIEGYSSLTVLYIIALVDEHFGKTISGKEFQNLTTVDSLIELIGRDQFTN